MSLCSIRALVALCRFAPYGRLSPYCLAAIRALFALLPATGNTRFWLRLCARAGALARIRLRYGGYVLGLGPLRAYAAFFTRPPTGRAPVLAHSKESFLFFIVSNHVLNYICTPLARDAVRYKPIVALA